MKRILDFFWPAVGLVAVVWSVKLLYEKLAAEAATDEKVRALLEDHELPKLLQHRRVLQRQILDGHQEVDCLLRLLRWHHVHLRDVESKQALRYFAKQDPQLRLIDQQFPQRVRLPKSLISRSK